MRTRYDVVPVTSAQVGLELLATDLQVVIVVSDLQMPEMDGTAFLTEVRARRPDIVRLLLTGNLERAAELATTTDGLYFRVLTKPCPRDVMIEALESALSHRR